MIKIKDATLEEIDKIFRENLNLTKRNVALAEELRKLVEREREVEEEN